MIFSSGVFLFIFLPITYLIYYNPIVTNRSFKNICLFFMSLVFYVWGEPIFAVVLISSIIFNYYTVKQMAKSKAYRKRYLFLIQGVNIFVLIVFKYISFVSQQCIEVFALDIEPIQISLPIGISFFTFQIMSYVFDVYYDRVPATNKILTLGLYTMMFPQLVAGPIVRYSHICNEIENRTIRSEEIEKGIIRFILDYSRHSRERG